MIEFTRFSMFAYILQHPKERFDEGAFVLLYPGINEACRGAIDQYRECLTNKNTLRFWTLGTFLDALGEREWVWSLWDRYCDFYRVDRAYQDFYLRKTTGWAQVIREQLGRLQDREGHRVQFRPSTTGVTMVGLLPDKPQLGRSYGSTAPLLVDFEDEFLRHCDGGSPKRATPEKQLQSFLVADALTHNRKMKVLNEASRLTDAPVELVFLTDELVIPSIQGDQRLDILALRREGGSAIPVLVELKTERAMTELLRQTAAYSEFLDNHRVRIGELASTILGTQVKFERPTEKWIVWPSVGGGHDPREAEFFSHSVRVVCYSLIESAFTFHVGRAAGPPSENEPIV